MRKRQVRTSAEQRRKEIDVDGDLWLGKELHDVSMGIHQSNREPSEHDHDPFKRKEHERQHETRIPSRVIRTLHRGERHWKFSFC